MALFKEQVVRPSPLVADWRLAQHSAEPGVPEASRRLWSPLPGRVGQDALLHLPCFVAGDSGGHVKKLGTARPRARLVSMNPLATGGS